MKPFEIFRTGTHTSSQGATLAFADGDISSIASSYDPTLHHAPIVVGHPRQDGPAYGWVKSLAVKGDRLVAIPENIDPAFSELVRDGKFKKVSAAFYQPSSPNNPTPGSYHLRHVGFLGAEPPAVKGLKAIEFSDADDVLVFADVELSDWRPGWMLDTIGRLFRGLRDHFVETAGADAADKLLPAWELEQFTQVSAEMRATDAVRAEASPSYSDPAHPSKGEAMTEQQKTEAERLAAREAEIARREATFAETQRAATQAADAAFVDSIVKAGRLPIGLQATATALFSDLSDEALTFSEGDEAKTTTPRAAFRDLLEKLPVPVSTGEVATGDGPDFTDAAYVQGAIETEIRTAREKDGVALSPAAAAMRLQAARA